MRVRIEKIGTDDPEEVIIHCREVTPEIETIVRQFSLVGQNKMVPGFFKGDEQYYLSLSEILFFETDAERVFGHTTNDAYEIKSRLYELEEILPGYFVRISRSTIVNIKHVFSIQKGITRVNLITFRNSHKAVYSSRIYGNSLIKKMEERSLYENS